MLVHQLDARAGFLDDEVPGDEADGHAHGTHAVEHTHRVDQTEMRDQKAGNERENADRRIDQ